MYTASSPTSLASNTRMPSARRRSVEALELDTAPGTRSFIDASASMNLLTVEPVPTPTISPGTTYFRAAWPTSVLSSSCVTRQSPEIKTELSDAAPALFARPPFSVRDGPRDRPRADAGHAGAGAGHAAAMGVPQRLRARSHRAGRPALSQPRRIGRRAGQECALHRCARRHGLRV